MGIAGILFNPNGRIAPNDFWRGVIVLLGLNIVLGLLAAYGPPAFALVVGLVGILFIYPMLCIYGKRLHDNGRTAWWFLAFVLGSFVLSFIAGQVIQSMMGIDVAAISEEAAQSGNIGEAMAFTQELTRQMLLPNILSSIAITFIVAWFAARLSSDPEANQYGPPTVNASETFS